VLIRAKQCKLSDMGDWPSQASAFIANGGIINFSFGGAIDGNDRYIDHVQRACKDINQLADLITSTLQKFSTHNVEFDIEGDYLMNDAGARTRLASAIAIVKQSIPDLHVTYTLATNPDGVPDSGMQQVQALKDAGVKLDILSLMTMDMVPNNVAAASISAVKAGAKQLENMYNLPVGSGLSRMGVIPMPGVDDQGAMFSLNDARALGQFAAENNIGVVSYWEFNRDLPGPNPNIATGINNIKNYAFFSALHNVMGVSGSVGAHGTASAVSSPASSSATSSRTASSTFNAKPSPTQLTVTFIKTVTATVSPIPTTITQSASTETVTKTPATRTKTITVTQTLDITPTQSFTST
jgi:hypothetical protein